MKAGTLPGMAEQQFIVRLTNGQQFGPAAMTLIVQWARENRVPKDALRVAADDEANVRPVLSEPALQAVLQAPPTMQLEWAQSPENAPLSGMIPYKNPQALIGYYVAIVSWIPLVGGLAGPAAIVLGIIGLRARLKDPRRRGLAHAWIAIIGGAIGTLITFGCFVPALLARR